MRACSSCLINNTVIPAAAQGSVTNMYRSQLSSNKEAVIKLTWSKSRTGAALSVKINNWPISTDGTKGNFSFILGSSAIDICWDFSGARYGLSPEPVSDYYVAVLFDKEFALSIGDRCKEFVNSFGDGKNCVSEICMVSRTVQVVGRAIYMTKARFYEEGREHEIMIRFQGELEMSMCVDEKKILHVRRLRWNFRGNDTFFIDGLAIDVMWDLFQWLFCEPSDSAMILLRTRVSSGCRVWVEDESLKKDEGFSLLIQVSQ